MKKPWVLIGVVLSVVWIVDAGATAWRDQVRRAESSARWIEESCVRTGKMEGKVDVAECAQKKDYMHRLQMDGIIPGTIAIALVPVPFIWLFGFIVLRTAIGLRAGFKAAVPWPELRPRDRAFAVLCMGVTLVAVMFATLMVLNLYVDTKVPVSLPALHDVIRTDKNFVSLLGTWERENQDNPMANPLQTSRIECDRSTNECIEARAEITGDNLMTSTLNRYEITAWDDTGLRFREEALCTETNYVVDFATETVSGEGHLTNQTQPFCEAYSSSSSEKFWKLKFSTGFDVYWREHKNARPWMLRVILAVAGN